MRLSIPVLAIVLFLVGPCVASSHGGPHGGSGHSSHSAHSSSQKTTHVHGYYRKDGTYVHGYDRGASGTRYKKSYVADGYAPHATVQRDSHGRIKRSAAAKDAFKQQRPCPSTGRSSGSCPGYVIDHVKPLECGGADAPSNMQWQTTSAAKAKDKTERYCR
jgi:hypothetical protein